MCRQKRIAEILAKRQRWAEKVDEVTSYTQNLLSSLTGLDELIKEYEEFDRSSEVQRNPIANERINTTSIRSILDSEIKNLRYLHERFSKPPLKIAVAGLPKEGKSTFIRAVTGLPEDVIPSSQYLCTGAPYTIYNQESNDTFAWVEFYSSDELLNEVIQPYYDDPDLNLSNKPASLETWIRPSLQINDEDAIKETKYKRLIAYCDTYLKYKECLNQNRIRAEKNQIRQYITQVNESREETHIYRAVKSAEIYTKFPNNDVGQIALIDTPGVGELRIQEEEKLVETLRKNSDIVICVILPRANEYTYQARHTNFFRLMQRGIGKAEKRCLLVLNDDGKNSEACNRLSTPSELEKWSLKFAQVFIANCTNPEEVGIKVVDPTLNYLAGKIESLDQDDVSNSFKVVLEKCKETTSILEKLIVEPSANIQYISSRKYRELFENYFVPKLRAAFKQMRLRFLNRNDGLSVKNIVRDKVNTLKLSVPSAEVIESRRNPRDTYDPVFEEVLGQLRVQALKHFQILDLELKPLSDEIKKIVAEELRQIGLDKLSTKENGLEFLADIYHLIPEPCQLLKSAFRLIQEFELAYFWLIRVKIYEGLETLIPEKNPLKPKSSNPLKPVTAELIYQVLNESYIKVKGDLLALLGGDATDDLFPNKAALAALDEFIDLAFYASDKEGRGIVTGDWQNFIELYKARIWAQDFEKLEEEVELRDRLSKVIEQARASTMKLQLVCDSEGTP